MIKAYTVVAANVSQTDSLINVIDTSKQPVVCITSS